MEKYITEPAKVHLNSHMETIRNHSIMKNIGQIQNFGSNTGDLKNSKHSLKYNQHNQVQRRTGICYLCLKEKLFIIEHQGNDLLNQRSFSLV